LILSNEQSGLLTRIEATEGGSLCERLKSSLRLWNCKGRYTSSWRVWCLNGGAERRVAQKADDIFKLE
jgi:hypothetical protein